MEYLLEVLTRFQLSIIENVPSSSLKVRNQSRRELFVPASVADEDIAHSGQPKLTISFRSLARTCGSIPSKPTGSRALNSDLHEPAKTAPHPVTRRESEAVFAKHLRGGRRRFLRAVWS